VGVEWFSTVVPCRDPESLARFWAAVLDYRVVYVGGHEVDIARGRDAFPGLVFVRSDAVKAGTNRLHLDLNPVDQAAEVARIIGLGAVRVDVGQPPDVPWVVLADPEGNEFCVLQEQHGWDPPPHHARTQDA
jgi:hypothetical protein